MATNEEMFGIIFHWGLYSVPAYCPVRNKRKGINNGSEWYLKRLTEKGTFRPITGWKETQKYHKENFEGKEYSDFKDEFLAENWNPDEWMKMAKDSGAEYVILTAKHHDGYCLWDTKTTNYNTIETGPKRDLISDFGESAKRYGLQFGIYYSWSEFGKGCTIDYLKTIVDIQIDELLQYKPDIWWFDGDWMCTTKFSNDFISDICDKLKEANPDVEINDRLGGRKELKEQRENPNFLKDSTYRSYGDREIPDEIPEVPWEHINTIGHSWGRNNEQTTEHYKTPEELYSLYEKVASMNGRFLLNLGPNSDGSLDKNEVKSIEGFGKLLKDEVRKKGKKKPKKIVEIIFEDD